ncbi:MAG: TOMM precursor leader peptide-binding protein [Anaerolineae bacterium]|nr:TOMM precursor leader peptide-binding protein [Anaerolineae bacterium]
MKKHQFIKRPQCPVCGDPEMIKERTLRPIELHAQPKKFTADGGHRTTTPEQTVARYKHHVSRITGVVSGLVKRQASSREDGLIHTYLSGVNLKFDSSSYEGLRSLYRGGDGGKGATDIQSQASAMCEAIERYSGSYHGNEHAFYATYEELGDAAIHPYKCLNFSESQYKNATAINRVTKTSVYNESVLAFPRMRPLLGRPFGH